MQHLAKATVALVASLALGLLVGAPVASATADGAAPDGGTLCCYN